MRRERSRDRPRGKLRKLSERLEESRRREKLKRDASKGKKRRLKRRLQRKEKIKVRKKRVRLLLKEFMRSPERFTEKRNPESLSRSLSLRGKRLSQLHRRKKKLKIKYNRLQNNLLHLDSNIKMMKTQKTS